MILEIQAHSWIDAGLTLDLVLKYLYSLNI